MKVYQLSKGAIRCQGNTLNVEQYVVSVFNKLPMLPEDVPVFVIRKNDPNVLGGCKDFKNQQKQCVNLACLVKSK